MLAPNERLRARVVALGRDREPTQPKPAEPDPAPELHLDQTRYA